MMNLKGEVNMDKLFSNAMDLSDLEAFLKGAMKPVTPRPEFMTNLKKQLMLQRETIANKARINPIYYVLLITASAINLLIFIAISIWTTLSTLSLIQLSRYIKRHIQQKRLLSQGKLS